MIKFFRKIRQNIIKDLPAAKAGNKVSRYLFYAIGEIILVVIGILIALSINNWNENRKIAKVQIAILKGIQNDISKDTIDINFNIRSIKNSVYRDSLLLNHLIEQKEQSDNFVNLIVRTTNSGNTLALQSTYYNEAKVKGLVIIENKVLRETIGRLYEFDYIYILEMENKNPIFQFNINLRKKLLKFVSINRDGKFISDSDYNELISDQKLHYYLSDVMNKRKYMLKNQYLPLIDKINNTLDLLSMEISYLEK
jgi:hypothetical protein